MTTFLSVRGDPSPVSSGLVTIIQGFSRVIGSGQGGFKICRGSGRVGSFFFKISRVGSGGVIFFLNLTGRVGSKGLKFTGRVGSGGVQNVTGRVGP